MRTVGSPCPFAALGLGLELPPVPIAATLVFATGAWTCTFDRPLQPAVLDFSNWALRATATIFLPTSASASGSIVTGASTGSIIDPGPDVVAYTPPPFDVLSLPGLPAVAFTDFPLVVS